METYRIDAFEKNDNFGNISRCNNDIIVALKPEGKVVSLLNVLELYFVHFLKDLMISFVPIAEAQDIYVSRPLHAHPRFQKLLFKLQHNKKCLLYFPELTNLHKSCH